MRLLRLNARLDPHTLSKRFAEAGRLQVEDFLEPPDAKELAEGLDSLDWRLVLNSGARHVDLPAQQLATMGEARMAAIRNEVLKSAANGFQYLYENYPVTDLVEA